MPGLRHRLGQAGQRLQLEPLFEADFHPVSFGLALEAVRSARIADLEGRA